MSIKRLYQQVVMDHNKNPRNFKELEKVTHMAHGVNPLCGDDFMLYLHLEEDKIIDIGFTGQGCAISKSVSSMMTVAVKDKCVEDVIKMKDTFIVMLTEELGQEEAKHILGHLSIFDTVKDFPIRVKCATLIWRALEKALHAYRLFEA